MPLPATRTRIGRRVLVVDDNVDAAGTLCALLTITGHEVHVANDGQAALRIATDNRLDAVLLDLGMPGMSGYEVARRLRREPADPPLLIVAVTGHGREEDRERSHQAGFDVHLVKPADPEEILSLLDGLIAPNR